MFSARGVCVFLFFNTYNTCFVETTHFRSFYAYFGLWVDYLRMDDFLLELYMMSCSTRLAEINDRIYARNVPSAALQPYLDVRPASTKYSKMPIVDPRVVYHRQQLIERPIYDLTQTFAPIVGTAPWSGYAANVGVETELQNRMYALQYSSQAVYVPSSKSDLYRVSWNRSEQPHVQQPFPELFNVQTFSHSGGHIPNDRGLFNNHTRQQLKDTKTPC